LEITDGSKVLIVGSFGRKTGPLEESYAKAFESLGHFTVRFDLERAIDRNCRLGTLGRRLNRYIPVEAWIRKANRELVVMALREKPSIIIVSGQNPVRGGALAQIAAAGKVKIILLWPDTLLNVSDSLIAALPMYDMVACYGHSSCLIFRRLGAISVEWIPLAGDPFLHPLRNAPGRENYECDVSFVGNWRPEREVALTEIGKMEGIQMKIWGGNSWRRFAKTNPVIMNAWQRRPLYGKEFSDAVAASKINLNIIDDTNFPSANMRFFEIPCAGGLEVCSPCPEMESEFEHGDTIFYYRRQEELRDLIPMLLKDDRLRADVAGRSHRKVLERHTYNNRISKILSAL
jgi:hypothetical protein